MTELAGAELVTTTTMHHVVKALIQDRLVRKIPDRRDKRRQIIHLTRKGRQAIVKAHQDRIGFLANLLEGQASRRVAEAIALLEALERT